jgi:hypothetical protein
MYYMSRPIGTIVRYMESLYDRSSFLSVILPYTGQCSHIGSAWYWYVGVYVMPLCYEMYYLLRFKVLKILKYCNWNYN